MDKNPNGSIERAMMLKHRTCKPPKRKERRKCKVRQKEVMGKKDRKKPLGERPRVGKKPKMGGNQILVTRNYGKKDFWGREEIGGGGGTKKKYSRKKKKENSRKSIGDRKTKRGK